ncbi:MAG TPA: 23S rRNA (uracil(1939)-C(5))-methyltransferase RlmD, partial [Syntrophorhabdaceae bacterium]|nr:23S rRNA (uracil(1939)-C(5))-methyltransferase RlmD [Syntrophorhabdaceae bacterium]HNT68339.1 23S rRNA (uracil(1939)-C(5))-methyltransferase RlmD [Syntrophorhabdaceae bacterium]
MTHVSVEITDVAFPNNYGVAKKDGRVIFVPGGVPGDIVRISIAREAKGYAYGAIDSIEKPSPFRTDPACPHFGICGGCTLQDLAYGKQLELKENYLRQTLKRIGGIDVDRIEVLPIMPSPDQYFYRSKVELAFGEKGGGIVLGMRERVSPFRQYGAVTVPVTACPVFSSVVEAIIPVVMGFAGRERLTPYNAVTGKGVLRHLIVRESKTAGEIMVTLETAQRAVRNLGELFEIFKKDIPQVKSMYAAVNNKRGDTIRYNQLQRAAGQSYITEDIAGMTCRVYPQSFFQPNTKAAGLLYEKISDIAHLSGNDRVLGLYCGMGPIEIYLSRRAEAVTGVDSSSENIINAQENCQINGVGNCVFYAGTVEKVLREISLSTADLLVIDPPRSGISKDGMGLITRLTPPRIAYVSCNPATLARDLKVFLSHGLRVATIAPFDFFPHTSHLETLAYLTRM